MSLSSKSQNINAMVTFLIFASFPHLAVRPFWVPASSHFVTVPSRAIIWDSSTVDLQFNSRDPPQTVQSRSHLLRGQVNGQAAVATNLSLKLGGWLRLRSQK